VTKKYRHEKIGNRLDAVLDVLAPFRRGKD
jgi:hypothetical protein